MYQGTLALFILVYCNDYNLSKVGGFVIRDFTSGHVFLKHERNLLMIKHNKWGSDVMEVKETWSYFNAVQWVSFCFIPKVFFFQ